MSFLLFVYQFVFNTLVKCILKPSNRAKWRLFTRKRSRFAQKTRNIHKNRDDNSGIGNRLRDLLEWVVEFTEKKTRRYIIPALWSVTLPPAQLWRWNRRCLALFTPNFQMVAPLEWKHSVWVDVIQDGTWWMSALNVSVARMCYSCQVSLVR